MRILTASECLRVGVPASGNGLWLRIDEHTVVDITADAGRYLTYALGALLDLEVRPRGGTPEGRPRVGSIEVIR